MSMKGQHHKTVGHGSRSNAFRHQRFWQIAAFLFACSAPELCQGQIAQQRFTVTVPEGVGLTTPSQADVDLELVPGTNAFPQQTWGIRSNSQSGVVVGFAVESAFAHQTIPTIKVDAGLDVSVPNRTGAANWQITKSSDQSSVADGDETAVVQVVADGAGTAEVGLVLKFILPALDEVPVGKYSTDVVCTITIP
ncbi:hypothetical protein Poly51_60740 [Rubripirellula tenax]|uniref:WxL domain-containing protein n=1 Tax=Rubripirellula tenax TaxID=2528015 RepID=A0A5C6E6N6_9BACT|nr:hypothetical protein [Rubripirellula tenax]TWU44508.1 hypothetical protein Poly51_60740 [Rubripirellula tenax]